MISKERQESFWKWCKLEVKHDSVGFYFRSDIGVYTDIDIESLDDLFKHAWGLAVEKLMEKWSQTSATDLLFANWRHEWELHAKDPAEALFLTLEKIKEENG